MQFVIITGLSGAGKTEAVRSFEDLGYFCVDNLPPALIPKFAELCAQSNGRIQRIALVSDIRGGQFFDSLFGALESLEQVGFEYTILFLEAEDEALVRRFKATRRRHPLAPEGGILEGIEAERLRLQELRGRAHRIIDTTGMTPHQLRQEITRSFVERAADRLSVSVVSFGFASGVPMDADLVFDVRFLPNPHWVESLAPATGQDRPVVDYLFKWPIVQRFMDKLTDLMDFLLPQYVNEGKSHLVVALGCTGGRHRSVALADRLGAFLESRGYRAVVEHRDLET